MDFGSAKVVEYLEPVMSKELLCKFPDNSAFDFDYSQSSIWSPLVPQAYKSMDFESDLDFATLRKLDFEVGNENRSLNKVTSNIKKRIRTTAFAVNLSALKTKKKKKKKIVSDFSPSPSFKGACNPVTKKVWNKVLKAASKHFKKKKKDSTVNRRLSNVYLREENIWCRWWRTRMVSTLFFMLELAPVWTSI
ncbi:uncharacterized protein LOC21392647 [Morus notabilis]|uniref:uncharacterized protein LOC21392647 n=1 Tax=Morus notabilis TaxID=981085 RepID=UPI000CED470F|nr:uncharacterized protein LOC21392647 [Morus notabilis]